MDAEVLGGGDSHGHPDNPSTEANFSVESAPGEIARVPAAGIADVDAVGVVGNTHKPVVLTEPSRPVHQERTSVEPCLELSDRAQGPRRRTRHQSACGKRAGERRPTRVEEAKSRSDSGAGANERDGIIN